MAQQDVSLLIEQIMRSEKKVRAMLKKMRDFEKKEGGKVIDEMNGEM